MLYFWTHTLFSATRKLFNLFLKRTLPAFLCYLHISQWKKSISNRRIKCVSYRYHSSWTGKHPSQLLWRIKIPIFRCNFPCVATNRDESRLFEASVVQRARSKDGNFISRFRYRLGNWKGYRLNQIWFAFFFCFCRFYWCSLKLSLGLLWVHIIWFDLLFKLTYPHRGFW